MDFFFSQVTVHSCWRATFPQLVIQSSYCRPLNIFWKPPSSHVGVRWDIPTGAPTSRAWSVDWKHDQSVLQSGCCRSLLFLQPALNIKRTVYKSPEGDFCGESPSPLFSFLVCFEPVCLVFFAGLPQAPCIEWRTYWFCSRSTDRNTGSADARLHVPCCRFFPTEQFSSGL